ncbi:MAG: T9SS type A sorting domain-containing protein, partial [Calditrichota bacterium]
EVVAEQFELLQNYPNPYNPTTRIAYRLEKTAMVSLAVYDLLGKQVAILQDGIQASGQYEGEFSANGLPGGIYLYRLSVDNVHLKTRKMLLVK